MRLLLASGSRYKASLLDRLNQPFEVFDANIDETPQDGEAPQELALRLARTKAAQGLKVAPDAVVIGADQVATSASHKFIGKPGSASANKQQLLALSGQTVRFFTAVTVASREADPTAYVDTTEVRFRELDERQIENYLSIEPAHDVAGGCKVEGFGITLLEAVESTDPTALIGMPLIGLCQALRQHGIHLP